MGNDIGAEFTDAITKVFAILPKDGVEGSFPCPVCIGGTIHWLRVGRKHHLRLGCTTPECVMVMQ